MPILLARAAGELGPKFNSLSSLLARTLPARTLMQTASEGEEAVFLVGRPSLEEYLNYIATESTGIENIDVRQFANE